MKIAFISAEVVPFAKTGGLADVAGALPKTLNVLGDETIIVMPHYKIIDNEKHRLTLVTDKLPIKLGDDNVNMTVYKSQAIDGVTTYFVGNGDMFYRDGIYGHADDEYRFTAFCKGVMDLLPSIDFCPDIIHANDWHTSLIPVFLKTTYKDNPFYRNTATVFTVHNLAYQGVFGEYVMDIAGLPNELFTADCLEFYGKFNFMKAGLIFSDKINTVSKTYAKEIQTKECGEDLDGVLLSRKKDLSGIVNGIDYDIWSPRIDYHIKEKFTIKTVSKKMKNKSAAQKELGLTVDENIPVFGLVSRLSYQKGLDILVDALKEILPKEQMQVMLLGNGEQVYVDKLLELRNEFPKQISVCFEFNDSLSHRIYAVSDFFFMPSRYEPCGLGQMISMSYGTLPIVRATGGLEDTVKEITNRSDTKGTGFKFEELSSYALIDKIEKALKIYKNKDVLNIARTNAMKEDFSWNKSAKDYSKLYLQAMKKN